MSIFYRFCQNLVLDYVIALRMHALSGLNLLLYPRIFVHIIICSPIIIHFNSENGVCAIDTARWQRAQTAELTLWRGNNDGGDRIQDHLEGFNNYKDLPKVLGNFIEIGCGPWTQSGKIFEQYPEVRTNKIFLWEPGIHSYISGSASF